MFINCKKTCMLPTAKNMCSVDCKLNSINRLQKTLQSRLQKLTFWSTAKISLLVDCKKNIYSSTAKCNFAVRSLCSRWISIILQSINKFWPLISRICSRWYTVLICSRWKQARFCSRWISKIVCSRWISRFCSRLQHCIFCSLSISYFLQSTVLRVFCNRWICQFLLQSMKVSWFLQSMAIKWFVSDELYFLTHISTICGVSEGG